MVRPAVLTAFALALLALAPAVAAEPSGLKAESASYRGGARQAGDLSAFYLNSCALDDEDVSSCAPVGAAPLLGLDITAEHAEALLVERRYIVAASGGAEQQDPRYPNDAPAQRYVLDGAKAQLTAQQPAFQLHLVPAGTGAVTYVADSQSGTFEAVDGLFMGGGQFRRAVSSDEDARNPDASEFWSVRIGAPTVVHEDQAGLMDVTFQGDVVLELKGATLVARDHDEEHQLESGEWIEPLAPMGLLDTAAVAQRDVLLRVFLTGATLRVTVQGGNPGLHLAGPEIVSDQAGESTLVGATGTAHAPDGEPVALDGDRYVLPAGSRMTLRPDGGEGLDLAIAPASAAAPGNGAFASQGPAALGAAVAVLALLAAISLGLLRRWTTPPPLGAVEAALEARHFGRAARMAKRILRARPDSEDAMLGRAIALSKAGRGGAAISEIQAHLGRRAPTDGSLHYVLGLALLDVGRPDDARIALEEAARLTPALHEDVAARLSPQGSSSSGSTPVREVHGYA